MNFDLKDLLTYQRLFRIKKYDIKTLNLIIWIPYYNNQGLLLNLTFSAKRKLVLSNDIGSFQSKFKLLIQIDLKFEDIKGKGGFFQIHLYSVYFFKFSFIIDTAGYYLLKIRERNNEKLLGIKKIC